MKNTFYFLSFFVLFASCRPEANDLSTINVEATFEPHVQAFIEEGAKRGHDIDFSDTGLSIIFGNTPNASASCTEIAGASWGSHQIIVNKEVWQGLNDTLRERLIFHELGHCELNRDHKNDKFKDGSWASMMRGDPLSDLDAQLPVPYFGFRRAYYIDELFNGQTPTPDWAEKSFEYNELAVAPLNRIREAFNLSVLNDTLDLEIDQYEIEFQLKTISGDKATWIAWGTEEQHYFFWFKDNEFHFSANSGFQGPFHSTESEQLDFRQSQKVTIRQDGPYCKIFLSEQFFFMVDRLPADLFFIMSSNENQIEIESYLLSEIL